MSDGNILDPCVGYNVSACSASTWFPLSFGPFNSRLIPGLASGPTATVAYTALLSDGADVASMWFCLTFTICLFPAPIKWLRTSLPGELRLAPHTASPGGHAFQVLLSSIASAELGMAG